MNSQNTKYNYIIYSVNQDYFTTIFNDIIKWDNVEYIPNPLSYYKHSRFVQKLYELHHNGYLNNFFSLPLKNIWIKTYFKDTFKNDKPKCFVFLMGWLNKDKEGYFKYLKKKYPTCMLVVYFEDLVSSRKNIDLALISKYFNLAISYDKHEANKLGLLYYPTIFSKIDLIKNCDLQRSDIHFCGAAKDRYQDILDVYNVFINLGVKCDFNVARLKPKQIKENGIHYINYMIPYTEYLQHVEATNCILEIVQKNCSGYTLRTWEALAFGKKMITNNKEILNAPFYNDKQFAYFQKPENINLEFIQSELQNPNINYISNLSPVKFLEFIDNNLMTK